MKKLKLSVETGQVQDCIRAARLIVENLYSEVPATK